MMEPTMFDEFISLCYRIAMTESASIQIHLVEMLSVLAASQDHTSDPLSLTSSRAHCLRICAHILRHSTPSSRAPVIRQYSFSISSPRIHVLLLYSRRWPYRSNQDDLIRFRWVYHRRCIHSVFSARGCPRSSCPSL
jgi:hypothetical protein